MRVCVCVKPKAARTSTCSQLASEKEGCQADAGECSQLQRFSHRHAQRHKQLWETDREALACKLSGRQQGCQASAGEC